MPEHAVRVVSGPFTDNQIAGVARLHVTEVSEGFLSSLGQPVLRLLYRHLAGSPLCALFLAVDEADEPVGYICGSRDVSALYKEFLLRRWWVATGVLVPRLLSPRRLVRAVETLRYPARSRPLQALPKAEIVNFVVVPELRGRGVSIRLFQQLMNWFEDSGETAVKIVTGERQVRARGFYEKAGARAQGILSVHNGVSSRSYCYPLGEHPYGGHPFVAPPPLPSRHPSAPRLSRPSSPSRLPEGDSDEPEIRGR